MGSNGYDTSSDYVMDFNGTSSATPAVAGIAGLILSINPCLTHQEVEDIIESTAQKVGGYSYSTTIGRPNGTWIDEMGYGLADAHAAVIAAQLSLPTGSGFDLMSQDRPFDTGVEPNPDTGPMWISEDIWVRQSLDGGTTHQNPEYNLYSPNGVYVKIRNIGSSPSPCANLSVYFSKASTGLVWPNHWINYSIGSVLHGDIINTVNIPEIPAGGTYTAEIPWYPPNPADFTTDIHHFCLLSRIISPSDPMYFELTGISVSPNVRNNNNIAWKNVSVYNVVIGAFPEFGTSVFIRPVREGLNFVDLHFLDEGFNENIHFPFFDRGGKLQVKVDPRLFERILAADLKEVEIAGDNELIIYNRGASINNMMLKEGETFAAEFIFHVPDMQPGEEIPFDLVQTMAGTQRVEGGERFVLRGVEPGQNRGKAPAFQTEDFAFPNPVTDQLFVQYEVMEKGQPVSIQLHNLSGNSVLQVPDHVEANDGQFTRSLDVSDLAPGIYFLHLKVGTELKTQKIIIGIN